MARYEHRPICKEAMDLTSYLEKTVRNVAATRSAAARSENRPSSAQPVTGNAQQASQGSDMRKKPLWLDLGVHDHGFLASDPSAGLAQD